MKVKSIMTRDVATCGIDDTLPAAARIMWEQDCGVVPVVDKHRRLVGVVTDRDLCMSALLSNKPIERLRVGDAMSDESYDCHPDDSDRAVHAEMRERQLRRLPVVDDDGVLVGVVTLTDLATEAFSGRSAAAMKRQRDVGRTYAAISTPRIIQENGSEPRAES